MLFLRNANLIFINIQNSPKHIQLKSNKTKAWIHAFRLRTLPLAVSSIILGSFLAAANNSFNITILIFALLTALFLQILSNLANDYGDSQKGTDNKDRLGPERAVQSGIISIKEIKLSIIIFVVLSLISGISLIYVGTKNINFNSSLILLVIGIIAIISAIRYTMGNKPYGYSGQGDIFVFLFFGLTGVLGSYFLYCNSLSWDLLLPASAIGLFSTAVLNLNNMRDIENDRKSNKNTLVVIMGSKKAKYYHLFLLSAGMLSALFYILINYNNYFQLLSILMFPLFIRNINSVYKNKIVTQLDPELKKLAISTLIFAIVFGFSFLL